MSIKFKSALYGLLDPLPYTGKEIENPFPNPIPSCEPKWDDKNYLWTFSAKLGDCGIYSSEENNTLIFEKRIWYESTIVTFKCLYGTDILVREIPPEKLNSDIEIIGKTVLRRGSMAARFSMLFFSEVSTIFKHIICSICYAKPIFFHLINIFFSEKSRLWNFIFIPGRTQQ